MKKKLYGVGEGKKYFKTFIIILLRRSKCDWGKQVKHFFQFASHPYFIKMRSLRLYIYVVTKINVSDHLGGMEPI